jgi:hypothetical protein
MILIIGESGTGKSTSIEELNHEETFIIQVLGKPLPFRGWRRKYLPYSSVTKTGNIYTSDNCVQILALIEEIDKNMPQIKNIIIDDLQYMMSNEFMRRVKEKGFDKYNDIAHNAWAIINKLNGVREDIVPIVMSHSESNDAGKTKLKTLGKLLDDKVVIEGMFTVVLQSIIFDSQYLFITQNNGSNTCKSPRGMFATDTIPNDLKSITDQYNKYNNADIQELKDDVTKEIGVADSVESLNAVWPRYKMFHKDEMIISLFKAKKTELEMNNGEA